MKKTIAIAIVVSCLSGCDQKCINLTTDGCKEVKLKELDADEAYRQGYLDAKLGIIANPDRWRR